MSQRETYSMKTLIFIYIMSLRIVVVCVDYLRNKNESNDKERKKENEEEQKINSVYISDKQRYLKFWFARVIAKSAFNN